MTQKTVGKRGSLSGVGIHTGKECTVVFDPAPADFGVQFFRRGKRIGENPSGVGLSVTGASRCTVIGSEKENIRTVEHLLAALLGLEICNIRMEVDGEEIPILDGSAAAFVRFFKKLGITDQKVPRPRVKITEPIFCGEKHKALAVYPAEEFSVAYTLDYDHPLLRKQTVDFILSPKVFEREIAPARTFCTEEESRAVREGGLGLGADTTNTLVISENGVVENKFLFADECARHKVLDLLGDLNLLGVSIVGRVVGLRSGHSLNCRLVELLSAGLHEARNKR